MIELRTVEKLNHERAGLHAAYRASFGLQDKGWIRHFACSWDKPAVLAYDGERCVGGLNYEIDDDDRLVRILFAWADADRKAVFARLLLRLRSIVQPLAFEEVSFTCHPGNEAMMKAVAVLGLEPASMTYHLPFVRLQRKGLER
jgi:hypothetical protein